VPLIVTVVTLSTPPRVALVSRPVAGKAGAPFVLAAAASFAAGFAGTLGL
jgi:hypothetical protein